MADRYPELVKLTVLGKSYEGRLIYLLKIGKPRSDDKKKPIVWMDSRKNLKKIPTGDSHGVGSNARQRNYQA